jgi:hypothetical protein
VSASTSRPVIVTAEAPDFAGALTETAASSRETSTAESVDDSSNPSPPANEAWTGWVPAGPWAMTSMEATPFPSVVGVWVAPWNVNATSRPATGSPLAVASRAESVTGSVICAVVSPVYVSVVGVSGSSSAAVFGSGAALVWSGTVTVLPYGAPTFEGDSVGTANCHWRISISSVGLGRNALSESWVTKECSPWLANAPCLSVHASSS